MTLNINGIRYFRTKEACLMSGITKNTFLRWVSNGNIPDVPCRDRRGWRLFTEKDIENLKKEANRINFYLVEHHESRH